MTRAIHISSLTYSYPSAEHPVLDIDELVADQGEICWVAGLSGAGKTTLCRLLAGLIPHFYRGNLSGDVTIHGLESLHHSLSDVTDIVGFVMDDPFDQLTRATYTVRDEIAFGLQNLGLPASDINLRIEEVMQDLGITHLADRLPTNLSIGEQQRVVIASIFARRPRVLVLDEATSQLDSLGSWAIFDLAINLKSMGNTIIIVEPEPDKVSQTADRLILLHQGKVLANGPVGHVLNSGLFEQVGLHLPNYAELASQLIAGGAYAGKLPVSLSEACEVVGEILDAHC